MNVLSTVLVMRDQLRHICVPEAFDYFCIAFSSSINQKSRTLISPAFCLSDARCSRKLPRRVICEGETFFHFFLTLASLYAAEYRVVPGTNSIKPFLTSLCKIPFILFSEPMKHKSRAARFVIWSFFCR